MRDGSGMLGARQTHPVLGSGAPEQSASEVGILSADPRARYSTATSLNDLQILGSADPEALRFLLRKQASRTSRPHKPQTAVISEDLVTASHTVAKGCRPGGSAHNRRGSFMLVLGWSMKLHSLGCGMG